MKSGGDQHGPPHDLVIRVSHCGEWKTDCHTKTVNGEHEYVSAPCVGVDLEVVAIEVVRKVCEYDGTD